MLRPWGCVQFWCKWILDKRFVPLPIGSWVLTPAQVDYSVTHQETLGEVWGFKYFKALIFGCPIPVYTNHTAVTEIFQGRKLSGRLACWYLTIQEFKPKFKHLSGWANVDVDALSRIVLVGATTQQPTTENFSLQELRAEQWKHVTRRKVILPQESHETSLHPTPISQPYLTKEGVLHQLAADNSDGSVQWQLVRQYYNWHTNSLQLDIQVEIEL